jgi:hypothetical protein
MLHAFQGGVQKVAPFLAEEIPCATLGRPISYNRCTVFEEGCRVAPDSFPR